MADQLKEKNEHCKIWCTGPPHAASTALCNLALTRQVSGALIVLLPKIFSSFCVLVRFKDGDYDDYCKETTAIRMEMGQPRVYKFSFNLSSVYLF